MGKVSCVGAEDSLAGWFFLCMSASPGSLYMPQGAGLTSPELKAQECHNPGRQLCPQPRTPVRLLARCLCRSNPTKALLFSLFQEGGRGWREE